jgi:hypothetical protein
MHQFAIAFFYACALISITFTAHVVIGKVSAQYGDTGYHSVIRASL